eukprot:360098-Chlamydomonas_euryale.AAC.1
MCDASGAAAADAAAAAAVAGILPALSVLHDPLAAPAARRSADSVLTAWRLQPDSWRVSLHVLCPPQPADMHGRAACGALAHLPGPAADAARHFFASALVHAFRKGGRGVDAAHTGHAPAGGTSGGGGGGGALLLDAPRRLARALLDCWLRAEGGGSGGSMHDAAPPEAAQLACALGALAVRSAAWPPEALLPGLEDLARGAAAGAGTAAGAARAEHAALLALLQAAAALASEARCP